MRTSSAVVRAAWVLAVDRDGFPFNDSLFYHTTAISLSNGNGYVPLTGGPTARWPPGFSTVLGALYWLFGTHPLAGELFNALVGAVTVVLLMLVVERTLDRGTAIVAGAMLAVLPGQIMWTDVLVSETLYTALFVAALLLIVSARPTPWWLVAIGAVPTVVGAIYGMNFEHMPELHSRYGYPLALLFTVVVCTILYRAFKKAGWL